MVQFVNEEHRKEKLEKLRKSKTITIVLDEEVLKCKNCNEELHVWGNTTMSLVCPKCKTINTVFMKHGNLGI